MQQGVKQLNWFLFQQCDSALGLDYLFFLFFLVVKHTTFHAANSYKVCSEHFWAYMCNLNSLQQLKSPVSEMFKCGSEAKEVEFLRSLHSVCLTLLMGPSPQNCHWKHLLEKFSILHTNLTDNRTQIAPFSSSKWRPQGSRYCDSAHLRISVDCKLIR